MENETQSERERGEQEGARRRETEKLNDRRERAIRKDNRQEGKNIEIAKARGEDGRDGQESLVEQGRKEKDGKMAGNTGKTP